MYISKINLWHHHPYHYYYCAFPLLCVVWVAPVVFKKQVSFLQTDEVMQSNRKKCNSCHCMERNLHKLWEVYMSMNFFLFCQFIYFSIFKNFILIFVCFFWYQQEIFCPELSQFTDFYLPCFYLVSHYYPITIVLVPTFVNLHKYYVLPINN